MYVYILLSQTKSRDHQNVASWHTGSVANTGTTTHMVCCKFNQIKRKTLYNCKSQDSINITMLHVSISRSSVIEHIPMFCIEMHN